MNRKWLEIASLSFVFGLIYLSPIQASKLPVFSGQFNNLDGSLYAVRFFDVMVSVFIVIFTSNYLIPAKLNRMSLLKVGISFIAILGVSSILEYGWDSLTLRAFNLPIGPGEISDKMLIYTRRETMELTIITGNLLVMASGLFYGLVRERNQQISRQEKLEIENLAAEVKYLRSQINPHFLFNTLNNIYAITQRNDDNEGSDALLRLSGLMRYMLYESAGESISLFREVEHLQNYIDLMLLKYKSDDPPQVEFQQEGDFENQWVAPLILIPFVENAFKHGIDNKGKGTIKMRLKSDSRLIQFIVENTRFPDRVASEEHAGIGLDNVKRRLEHHYPNAHELDINLSDDSYKIDMRISV